MRRLSGLVICLVLGLVVGFGVQAQENPLMIVMDGALYSWSGEGNQGVTPSRACASQERIVSDITLGSRGQIAYLTEPQDVSDMVQQFGAFGGPLPSNITLCSGNGVRTLAGQPDNFSFFNGDTPDVAVSRSTPTWSPDGTALAWTSFDLSSGQLTLDLFNSRNQGNIISKRFELSDAVSEIAPPHISWHDRGIFMFHASLDLENFGLIETLFVFDGLGNLVLQTIMPATDESRFVFDKFIVKDAGQDWVGLLYNDGEWELVDPASGEVHPAGGVGELYGVSNPNGISLLLSLDADQQYVWTAKNEAGIISDVNGNNVTVPGVFPTSTTLSSSGKWVFQLFDGLYYWSMTASGFINGTEAVTNGFSALAWSDTQWRIYRDS